MLRYLWIPSHLGFFQEGFNLDHRFFFQFDPKSNTLDIQDRDWYGIDDFYNKEIAGLTGIIGDNAAGKSKFLKYISSWLSNISSGGIVVFGDEIFYNKLWIKEELKLTGLSGPFRGKVHGWEGGSYQVAPPEQADVGHLSYRLSNWMIPIAYVSNSFFDPHGLVGRHVSDYSTKKLLAQGDPEASGFEKALSPLEAHDLADFYRQIQFLKLCDEHKINLPFKSKSINRIGLNFSISLSFGSFYRNEDSKVDQLVAERVDQATRVISHKWERIGVNFLQIRDETATREVFAAGIFSFLRFAGGIVEDEEGLFEELRRIDSGTDFFRLLFHSLRVNGASSWNKYQKVLEFIFGERQLGLTMEAKWFAMQKWHFFSSFVTEDIQFKIERDAGAELLGLSAELTEYSQESKKNIPMLNFSWHMSSGERSILNLFSRISFASRHLSNQILKTEKISFLLLLIDEPDLHLHPEWQRNLVHYFNELIPKFLLNVDKVQLLFATHSPLAVADLPREHLLTFRSDTNNQNVVDMPQDWSPFGADHFQLYQRAFGVKDNFFSEFGRRKLQEIFAPIAEKQAFNHKDASKMRKFTAMIGDPVIRKQLEGLIKDWEAGNP